ncbi:MAG: competence/damage-inducible protein A [Verrucomicrobia bacterium]|nr:competence/damage-inducible protein A [Verrucomicrobiota bacterium]
MNIGTELLMGFVVNTHAAYLGRKLNAMGATLARQVCVNDTPADIVASLREALERANLVITTGGLGPTSDDITLRLVVETLGLKTHLDERALKNICERFRRRGLEMPDSVKGQAVVPDIATVLYNEHGTAPGLAIPVSRADGDGAARCPTHACQWLVMLPGPPRELCPMFETQVMPLLQREFQSQLPALDCRVFKIVGLGESAVADLVEPVLKDIEGLEIGYCARSGEVDLRLAARGRDAAAVRRRCDQAEARSRKILGDAIFGTGDISLEQTVVELLRRKRKIVTTAESCTGGSLANRLTLVSGSSEAFRGGWVTYSNDEKTKMLDVAARLIEEHGAVSEPVARAMAEGALRKSTADYAIATTGIAGPTGGTEAKPVGTVFIALASSTQTRVESFRFQLDRETFKFIVTQTALNMLRKELLML